MFSFEATLADRRDRVRKRQPVRPVDETGGTTVMAGGILGTGVASRSWLPGRMMRLERLAGVSGGAIGRRRGGSAGKRQDVRPAEQWRRAWAEIAADRTGSSRTGVAGDGGLWLQPAGTMARQGAGQRSGGIAVTESGPEGVAPMSSRSRRRGRNARKRRLEKTRRLAQQRLDRRHDGARFPRAGSTPTRPRADFDLGGRHGDRSRLAHDRLDRRNNGRRFLDRQRRRHGRGADDGRRGRERWRRDGGSVRGARQPSWPASWAATPSATSRGGRSCPSGAPAASWSA